MWGLLIAGFFVGVVVTLVVVWIVYRCWGCTLRTRLKWHLKSTQWIPNDTDSDQALEKPDPPPEPAKPVNPAARL